MDRDDVRICGNCGFAAEPDSDTPGSMGIELVLWLCFIVPGLIYSLWRLSRRHDVCRKCGSANLVPLDTPMGRELSARFHLETQLPALPPRHVPYGGYKMGRALGSMFSRRR